MNLIGYIRRPLGIQPNKRHLRELPKGLPKSALKLP